MPKVIQVQLYQQSLEKAAQWLEDYAKNALPKYCKDLISLMCKRGEDFAVNSVGHIDTGNTLTTIAGYRRGDKGVIIAGGAAIWIEFGTGVARNFGSAPHPKAAELGMSPWGTFGKGHGASFNGWYYPDETGPYEYEGKRYSHTLGIPANHFMYNTAQELKRACPEMAREVFGK